MGRKCRMQNDTGRSKGAKLFRFPMRCVFSPALVLMLGYVLAAGSALQCRAADTVLVADSVNTLFPVSRNAFDPSFGQNGPDMEAFLDKARSLAADGRIERITVSGYASPDGPHALNMRLSRERSEAMAEYLRRQLPEVAGKIVPEPRGINWEGLRRLVEERGDVPYKEEVLRLLDSVPEQTRDSRGTPVGSRRKSLMDLRGGRPYRWLLANIFPELRNAVTVNLYSEGEPEPETIETVTPSDTITYRVEGPEPPEISSDSISDNNDISTTHADILYQQNFALKTNLLYYGILMPNLEVEWRFADHWSASVEWNMAWYAKDRVHKIYRVGFGDAELRYWIRPRERWSGWHVGVMAGGGLYDIERGNKGGWQGEGGLAGVTAGYMWRLGKHFIIDTNIGVGYMGTRVKDYEHIADHHPYLRTRQFNYFGPISLKVALGWRFDYKSKPLTPVETP